MRLADAGSLSVSGRRHFLKLAARAMRQILNDAARARNAQKRGGDWKQVTLEGDLAGAESEPWDVIDLHDALERLAALDPELERLVELRFFAGLTVAEAASALDISPGKRPRTGPRSGSGSARSWTQERRRPAIPAGRSDSILPGRPRSALAVRPSNPYRGFLLVAQALLEAGHGRGHVPPVRRFSVAWGARDPEVKCVRTRRRGSAVREGGDCRPCACAAVHQLTVPPTFAMISRGKEHNTIQNIGAGISNTGIRALFSW